MFTYELPVSICEIGELESDNSNTIGDAALTAGEMYPGAYSDLFSSLPANCFIRKPITNEELLEHLEIVMYSGQESYCY
ncbi:MAG: hypothetical protein WBQ25_04280 [Nitrososphaeraceae archaeon]